MPLNGDRWELEVLADCDAPYMFGPNDKGEMFVVATVDIPPELVGESIAPWIRSSNAMGTIWPCIEEPVYGDDTKVVHRKSLDNRGTLTFLTAGEHRIEFPVVEGSDVYLRLCPDNGKFPGAYPADKSIDPEDCVGDWDP